MVQRIAITATFTAILIAAGALWLSGLEPHPPEGEAQSRTEEAREPAVGLPESAHEIARAEGAAEGFADKQEGTADTAVEIVPGTEPTASAASGNAVVAGRVLVAGRRPETPFTLALVDRSDSVLMRLGASYVFRSDEAPKATTDEEGRFRFDGLAEDWAGSIQLPAGYALRSRAGESPVTHIGISAPTSDVLIDLDPLLAITGRVLSRSDNRPVEGATIAAIIESGDEIETPESVSGPGGRFMLGRTSRNIERLTLLVAHEERLLFGKSEVESPAILDRDGSVEVGAIYLSHVRMFDLYVSDSRGRPIAGARAFGVPPTMAFSERTDDKGYVQIQIMVGVPESGALAVRRDGFWTQVLDLPREGADARVVLDESNRIEVVLETETGAAPSPGYTVAVQADQRLDAVWDARLSQWISLSEEEGMFLLSGGGVSAKADEVGKAVVEGIRPGRPFVIEVSDLGGAVVAREPVPALGKSQSRQHRVVVPEATGVVSGVVVDDVGKPIEGASIWVVGRAEYDLNLGDPPRGTTDANGRFRIEGLYEEQVSLNVGHDEFVGALVEEVSVGQKDVTLTLQKGNRVIVRVIDEDANPITGVQVWGRDLAEMIASRKSPAEELGSGLYLFTGLRHGEIGIEARLDGTKVAIRHDTAVSEANIVVPSLGSLIVEWELPPEVDPKGEDGSGEIFDLVLVPRNGEREHLRLLLFTAGNPTGVKTFDHVPAGEYWAGLRSHHPDRQRITQPVPTVVEPRTANRLRIGP